MRPLIQPRLLRWVVPAVGVTIATGRRARQFMSELLPAFGAPGSNNNARCVCVTVNPPVLGRADDRDDDALAHDLTATPVAEVLQHGDLCLDVFRNVFRHGCTSV